MYACVRVCVCVCVCVGGWRVGDWDGGRKGKGGGGVRALAFTQSAGHIGILRVRLAENSDSPAVALCNTTSYNSLFMRNSRMCLLWEKPGAW